MAERFLRPDKDQLFRRSAVWEKVFWKGSELCQRAPKGSSTSTPSPTTRNTGLSASSATKCTTRSSLSRTMSKRTLRSATLSVKSAVRASSRRTIYRSTRNARSASKTKSRRSSHMYHKHKLLHQWWIRPTKSSCRLSRTFRTEDEREIKVLP